MVTAGVVQLEIIMKKATSFSLSLTGRQIPQYAHKAGW